MATVERQIAVFFDAENIACKHVELVRMDLLQRGRLLIRRAYGDFQASAMKEWVRSCKSYAIDMVSRPEVAAGKNASDIAMVIDSMECLVTRTNIDTFALVSSDSDCTPLALRLREHGKIVIGFGGRFSPAAFRQACDEFVVLRSDALVPPWHKEDASPRQPVTDVATPVDEKDASHSLIREALAELEHKCTSGTRNEERPWVHTDHLLNFVCRLRHDFRSLLRSWNVRWAKFLTEDKLLELSWEKSGTGYTSFVRHASDACPAQVPECATPVKRKRDRSQEVARGTTNRCNAKKPRQDVPAAPKTVTTIKELKTAVLGALSSTNRETGLHISDILRPLQFGEPLLSVLESKGYRLPSEYILNMKKLKVTGQRVQLLESER